MNLFHGKFCTSCYTTFVPATARTSTKLTCSLLQHVQGVLLCKHPLCNVSLASAAEC